MMRLRIVFGNSSLARYQQGGGHWSVRLQYLLGLRALRHEVVLLEIFRSSGNARRDEHCIHTFFRRLEQYNLAEHCALLLFEKDLTAQQLSCARVYGKTAAEVKELITGADVLWNDCYGIRPPLLGMFRHRVLIDLDPGLLQVAGLSVDIGLAEHQAYLSVGKKLHDADCPVPTLGVQWHSFLPFVYLPMWESVPDPGHRAPFTSVTHWTWGAELWFQQQLVSTSKRDAYLRYLNLPRLAGRPFELAVNILPEDHTGDRELLLSQGWQLVDPWEVIASPAAYQSYIAKSRAEILCPKPIFRELRTGWFSDRSACYLASGRPVLAEDTGFSDYLPTGKGLLVFHNLAGAAAGAAEIDAYYPAHSRSARQLAEEFLDSRRCLKAMLAASG